jgi:hypothetical protein
MPNKGLRYLRIDVKKEETGVVKDITWQVNGILVPLLLGGHVKRCKTARFEFQ